MKTFSFREILPKNDVFNEGVENFKNKWTNEKVIVWGVGSGFDYLYNFFERCKIEKNIKFLVDNDKAKWGHEKNGIKILSPDNLKDILSQTP